VFCTLVEAEQKYTLNRTHYRQERRENWSFFMGGGEARADVLILPLSAIYSPD